MSKRLDKDLIKDNLTLQDIKKIVNKLGGDCIISDNKILCQTICHNPPSAENSYKLYYYDNNKMFHCYTGCEEPTFDIFELVRKAILIQTGKELNFIQSVRYVVDEINIDIESVKKSEQIDNKELDYEKYCSKKGDEELKTVECVQLDNLETFRIFDWEKEHISFETLKKFNIKFDTYKHKIIIPHYNKNGELVGIRGRAILLEDIEKGKYAPVYYNKKLYNHPLGYNLYGLNNNLENIKDAKRIIIVEGEKSVLQIDSYLPKNISVAVCGSNISQWQINTILELGVEEIILAFDKEYKEIADEEYWKYYKKLKKLTDKMKNYVKVSVVLDTDNLIGYKESPSDRGKDIFLELINKRSFVKDEI